MSKSKLKQQITNLNIKKNDKIRKERVLMGLPGGGGLGGAMGGGGGGDDEEKKEEPSAIKTIGDEMVAGTNDLLGDFEKMTRTIGLIKEKLDEVKHTYFAGFSTLTSELDSDKGGSPLDTILNDEDISTEDERRLRLKKYI